MKKFLAIVVVPVLILAVLNLCPAIAGIWVDGGDVDVDINRGSIDANVDGSIHGSVDVDIDNFDDLSRFMDIYGDLERIAVLALCVIGFVAGWRKIIPGLSLFIVIKILANIGYILGPRCIPELIDTLDSDVARLLFVVLVGSWLRRKFKKPITSN